MGSRSECVDGSADSVPRLAKNAEESDLRPDVWGRRRSPAASRCGAGAEEKVIEDLLVLQSQPCQFVQDRKNHMNVFNGQQLFIAIGEPLIAGVGLALGTMSGSA